MLKVSSFKLRALATGLLTAAALATLVPLPSVVVHRHAHGAGSHTHAPGAVSHPKENPAHQHSASADVHRATRERAHPQALAHHRHEHRSEHSSQPSSQAVEIGHDDWAFDLHGQFVATRSEDDNHRHFQSPFLSSLATTKLALTFRAQARFLALCEAEFVTEGQRLLSRSRGPPRVASI